MDKFRVREYTEACDAVPGVVCNTEVQMEAFTNTYFAACDIIGGVENTTYDYPEDDPEYVAAVKYLKMHDRLVEDVADSAMRSYYGAGFCSVNRDKHIRFASKKFVTECAEAVVKAMGY